MPFASAHGRLSTACLTRASISLRCAWSCRHVNAAACAVVRPSALAMSSSGLIRGPLRFGLRVIRLRGEEVSAAFVWGRAGADLSASCDDDGVLLADASDARPDAVVVGLVDGDPVPAQVSIGLRL